ncbi:hypothetical protein ACVRXB_07305 [Streptococcus pantholopis]
MVFLFLWEYDKRAAEDASKLRFQTEQSISLGNETEGSITKNGAINTISNSENTMFIITLAYINVTATLKN